MLSKISDETFEGGGTFDDLRFDEEIALSMTRLAARSDHERVGISEHDGGCSLSLTLEQVTQQEWGQ